MDHYLQYMLPAKLKDTNEKAAQDKAKETVEEVFTKIIQVANITDSKKKMGFEDWQDPTCAECMLIYYLYSIEPPFY